MTDFDKYYRDTYPTAMEHIRKHLAETQLDALEELCLRVMHLFETAQIEIPDTDEGRVFKLLAIKAVNDLLGFIGCCRAGTSWSAQHQLRALFEIYACTWHLVCKPESRAKRFARFTEYSDFVRYQRLLQDAVRYAPDELARERMIPVAEEERLRPREAHWKGLYGKDALKVQHWHSPATIRTLFEDLNLKTSNDDAAPDWWQLYEMICHMTHVSPVGHKAVGARGLPLLGFPRDLAVLRARIGGASEAFIGSLVIWDQHYVPEARLGVRTNRWIIKCREHALQAAEYGKRNVP
jgi:hypothetical protein